MSLDPLPLTRPVLDPASPQRHELHRRAGHLGYTLYPDLMHRRACAVMAAAARKVSADIGDGQERKLPAVAPHKPFAEARGDQPQSKR